MTTSPLNEELLVGSCGIWQSGHFFIDIVLLSTVLVPLLLLPLNGEDNLLLQLTSTFSYLWIPYLFAGVCC